MLHAALEVLYAAQRFLKFGSDGELIELPERFTQLLTVYTMCEMLD